MLATDAERFEGAPTAGFLSETLPALAVVGLIMRDKKSPPAPAGAALATDPTLDLFGFLIAAEVWGLWGDLCSFLPGLDEPVPELPRRMATEPSGGDRLRTEADDGALLLRAAADAVVGANAELRIVGGFAGSRAVLATSGFCAAAAFAFTVVVAGRGFGAVDVDVGVDAAAGVRALEDAEVVFVALVVGFALDKELELDVALRAGLLGGNAGEGSGDVVLDFDGGSERVFPDLLAVTDLAVLLEEADLVGDLGAGAPLTVLDFGFGSSLAGFACSSFFSTSPPRTGSIGVTGASPFFVETFSKAGSNTVGLTGSCFGCERRPPFIIPKSFLEFNSSGVLTPLSASAIWSLVSIAGCCFPKASKASPDSFWPSGKVMVGLVTEGLTGTFCSPRSPLLLPVTATNEVLTLPSGLGAAGL